MAVTNEHRSKGFRAKYQVEFYFGDYNYPHDRYLRSQANEEGWVSLGLVNGFNMMRSLELSIPDIVKAVENSTVVETKVTETQTFIRKKKASVNEKVKFLGFDSDGIRKLSVTKFNEFIEHKEMLEELILGLHNVFVMTSAAAQSAQMRKFEFRRVIIDEAT